MHWHESIIHRKKNHSCLGISLPGVCMVQFIYMYRVLLQLFSYLIKKLFGNAVRGANRVPKKFNFFLLKFNMFCMFWIVLMCLCQKWFLKNKKTSLTYISIRKVIWKATITILPNILTCWINNSHFELFALDNISIHFTGSGFTNLRY